MNTLKAIMVFDRMILVGKISVFAVKPLSLHSIENKYLSL